MNTSDADSAQLIDVDALTRLANQFFSALPGTEPVAITPDLLAGSGHHPSGVSNIRQPQTSLPDPHGMVAEEVPAVPDHLPHSQTGLGTSPSAAQQHAGGFDAGRFNGDGFNAYGDVVNSVPRDMPNGLTDVAGFSPLSRSLPLQGMPDMDATPFDAELQNVLRGLQMPVQKTMPSIPSASAPQYYFMEHARGVPGTTAMQGTAGNPVAAGKAAAPFDIELVRRDFPILQERVNGRQLVWLDNAATTQKPCSVIERISYFYEHENSNIHRAAHELAARATDAYEGARDKVRCFLNARSANEIVFVRGTTEAINLVAQSWGKVNIGAGDEIVVSWLEHHANIVPWFRLCEERGAKLRVIPVDDDGQILIDEYAKLLGPRTKLVAFTQVSNALGTITPAKQMIDMAHAAGATVLLDGAQSVSHMRVDVQQLNADFFVFSGHKIFGPTGIGVLYGKEVLLNDMPPWQGGGNMIKDVTFENIQYHAAPTRFEAGTGNIADAVGLGAALDYVCKIGIDVIGAYEHQLLLYATRLLKDIPGLRLIGTAPDKASVMSFVLDGFKTEDVGAALNKEGIAVRSGHHCAQPILRRFGVEGSVRPSLAFYNNCADVDRLIGALERIVAGRKFGY